ncbi:MAG: HAMP domain-containing histidine kinase [Phycisphaerales bacterium]|nr:HAMP domain-containing histidine kinase [Phycisphaerales bacterium]
MNRVPPNQVSYEPVIRSWEERTSRFRRFSARIGLQGKLILSFAFLLLLALAGSYILFAGETRRMFDRVMGETSAEIAQTLARASETPLEENDIAELTRIGKDLLKNREIVSVAFYDASGNPISFACQDPDYAIHDPGLLPRIKQNTQRLMQVVHGSSPVIGNYAQVTAPVLRLTQTQKEGLGSATREAGTRLIGYVSVSRSEFSQQEHLKRTNIFVSLIGGAVFMLSLPIVFALVHRIFHPIRQLVCAADKIAGGELSTQVAIHRPDVIGTLARSFNEMVKTVHRQQQDLERANQDLEQRIDQRTAQWVVANKRLSAEIAEKEDFLRAVSHDLNAPLRNISGMATMLMMKYRGQFDEDVIHRLERIQKNVEVETGLIAELLELSRIKTRRQKMEPVEIQGLVQDLGDIFENDLKDKQIELVIDGRLPVLNCERSRLRQVFQNLIDNAIKYMGEGEIREIHVGCEMRQSEAEFYVRDTGMGIDPEEADKIFYVFRRGKQAASQQISGKGVGLASVKSIIETYSGTIWVQSSPGQGSTFRFTINGQFVSALQGKSTAIRTSVQDKTLETVS